MEEWFKENGGCKKIAYNKNTYKNTAETTEKLFENIRNNRVQEVFTPTTINNNPTFLNKNETLGLDRKNNKKLKRGEMDIDFRIDFHGFRKDEAFDYLIQKINFAYNQGFRCILVVTGKGLNTKEGELSIKDSIGDWLKHYLIADKLIKYTDASQKDGGTGAIYVLLKRNKNL